MEKNTTKELYIEAIGRRKTSTARVRISESTKNVFMVNDVDVKEYFKTEETRRLVLDPMAKGITPESSKASVKWNV